MPDAQPDSHPRLCQNCGGASSDIKQVAQFFSKYKKWLCPRCSPKPVGIWDVLPVCVILGLVIWIGSVIAYAHATASVNLQHDQDHVLICILTWTLTWLVGGYLLTCLHEFAHAAVARLLRMKLDGISIGRGPRLFRWRLRRIFIDIYRYPSGGLCHAYPQPGDRSRWRSALMIAAGPATHLTILLIMFALWNPQDPVDDTLTLPGTWDSIAAALFFLNLITLLFNLFPHYVSWNGRTLRNDGGRLWDMLIGKDSISIYHLLGTLIAHGDAGNWVEIQRSGRSFLQLPVAKAPQNACALGAWLAVADVWAGGEENLKEADTLSTRCMQAAPADSAILTVRACVLLALHRDEEAEKLLSLCKYGPHHIYSEKAAAHLWTELHRRRNNPTQMLHWQTIAQKLDPTAAYKLFRDPTPASEPQPTNI